MKVPKARAHCKLCNDTGIMNFRAINQAEKDAFDSGNCNDIPEPIKCSCKEGK